TLVTISGNNMLVRLPKITERITAPVGPGNALPQVQTTGLAAIPDEIGHALAGPPTQRHPDPAFVRFLQHKRPHLIQFQHVIQPASPSVVSRGGNCCAHCSSHLATVRRDTPNTRSMPRRLSRSNTARLTCWRVCSS